MRDGRNLLAHELVGLHAVVTSSSDPGQKGLEGTIVDETRNMLVIESGGRRVSIQKEGTSLRVDVDGGTVIDCGEIKFKPEDRVKRCMRHRRKEHAGRTASS